MISQHISVHCADIIIKIIKYIYEGSTFVQNFYRRNIPALFDIVIEPDLLGLLEHKVGLEAGDTPTENAESSLIIRKKINKFVFLGHLGFYLK